MISILIAIFTFTTTIGCQEISTSTCGVDKACWKRPPSCTSSTDCEFLMTYRRKTTDVNIMEFEISSKVSTGWIALGFNPSSLMSGTRGEMCIFNGASGVFQGFHATGYSPTYHPSPAANSVLTGVSLVSGSIVCRFSRPVTPSGYQGSLGPNIYPILAAGTVSGGSPSYHGSNKVIGTLTDLTAFNVVATTTMTTTTAATTIAATTTVSTAATTTATIAVTTTNAIPIANSTDKAISASTVNSTSPSTTSMTSSKMPYNSTQSSTGAMTSPMTSPMSTNSNPTNSTPGNTVGTSGPSLTIDLTGCSKTKGCFRVPSGCAVNSCKYIATWKSDPVKKEVRFEIMARAAGWVAFGLNAASAKMPGTYGEICYKDGSKKGIKGFHATKRGTPDLKNLSAPYLNVHQVTASNGGLVCRYSRKFSAMGNLGININQDLYVVVASGSGLNGGVPGYHGVTRYASKTKYNVAATTFGNVNGTAFRQESSAAVVVLLGILTCVGQQMFN